jgi:L-ribulose-5-phosphate 3-epimerase
MHASTRRQFLAWPLAASLARALPLDKIRLGITTDEIDEDAATAVRFLREFNLGWAEVRSVWGKYNTSQPLDKIRELKSLFDENQVRTSILSTAFFKIPLPADTPQGRGILDNQWALLSGAMERAKILGVDKLRVFAFTHPSGQQPDASAYPRIHELVREASRRAAKQNFRLAIENVGDSYVWTGAQAAALLKAVPEDSLGLAWDPNNAAVAGEKSYPDGYKLLDPARIIHVHLRDFRHVGNKVEWCAVGEGEMDNVGQIRSLRKAGYKETFTLETHYKHPQGKAMASRTSLEGLLKVVREV